MMNGIGIALLVIGVTLAATPVGIGIAAGIWWLFGDFLLRLTGPQVCALLLVLGALFGLLGFALVKP